MNGDSANVEPMTRPLSLFWRVFAVNAGVLGALAALLLVSPVRSRFRSSRSRR